MTQKFSSEFNFLLKISTLFFVLWLGFIYPRFINDKKAKNITLIEKQQIFANSTQLIQKIH
jgi:hypothetical protein